MKKSFRKVVSYYLLSIIVFSTVYWLFWMKNTSYFMVNQEFNEITFAPMFFDENPGNLKKGREKSVIETNEELRYLHSTIDSLNIAIKQNQREQYQYNKFLDTLNDRLWESYKVNSKLAITDSTKEIKQKIGLLEQKIKINEIAKLSLSDLNQTVVLAKYKSGLAQLKLQEAKIIAGILNRKFETYFDKKLLNNNILAGKKDSIYRINGLRMLRQVDDVQGKIYDVVVDYHSKRFDKLNYWDFLYFSAGTATSSNFGDILPNTRIIRVVVLVQILLSLVIFGWLICLLNSIVIEYVVIQSNRLQECYSSFERSSFRFLNIDNVNLEYTLCLDSYLKNCFQVSNLVYKRSLRCLLYFSTAVTPFFKLMTI